MRARPGHRVGLRPAPRGEPVNATRPRRDRPDRRATTAGAARESLNQAPAGQTATTIDRSQFDNRPSFSVGDVLRDSPGISIKQGNGPRDFGISIRGSNARNGFGIRNLVIFDDGFPVTQPDGLSRSDLIDPHAYGAIDVVRGPSSALYGNYATGGALNFRTRPGGTHRWRRIWRRWRQLRLSQQLSGGRQEGRQFRGLAVRERRAWRRLYRQQLVQHPDRQLPGTLKATPDDRFTVKLINNDLSARLPIRLSLNQYYQNPVPAGLRERSDGRARLRNRDVEQQRLQHDRRNGHRNGRTGRASAATIAAPSSAVAGSTISTTPRPGATSSCSTIATSVSRPGRPARSATSRPITT